MKKKNPQKKRTRRLCAYAFLLSLCALLTGLAFLIADQTNGQVLFGGDYRTPLPTVELPLWLLPARWRILWELLQG